MNEREVESLISGLQPRGPTPALFERVQHELELDEQWLRGGTETHRPQPRWRASVAWAAIGAAAAVAIAGVLSDGTATHPARQSQLAQGTATSRQVMPVSTVREIVGTRNEGIHYNSASRLPEQHLKVFSMERHDWIDPDDGARITLEVPHEERVILPASFQ